MEIIAIRHGETEQNKDGKVMGSRVDAPLDSEGRKQARRVTEELVKYGFTHMYSSPLLRAKQTAEIVNEVLNIPLEFSELLVERDLGELSGEKYERVLELLGENALSSKNYDFRPYGGESYGDVKDRVVKFLGELEEKHDENDLILIATHAEVLRVLYELNPEVESKTLSNVCIHDFTSGDHGHLEEKKA